jgi:PiT family inorganic phosphate transporter
VLATVKFIPLAPLIGLVVGYVIMVSVFWIFRRWKPSEVDHLFRKGQLLSASLYSLGHGGNDAQKTMGIIMALLIAAGMMDPQTQLSLLHWNTLWIILSCHAAMAVGTAMGGWRIVKTMGMKLTKLKPVNGFCAETAGAITLFAVTHAGIPVSTTHTIAGAIVGIGATNKLSAVKWGIAMRIVWTWLLTIPFSGLVAAGCFYLIKYFHPHF